MHVSYIPKHVPDNHASSSSKIVCRKDLRDKSESSMHLGFRREYLQVMCPHPPFLLIYLSHPGHLFAIFLIIFSLCFSTLLIPALVSLSYSSHVRPECQGEL